MTRIIELTEDHISRGQVHTYLAVNQHTFVLPPKLARLIDDQLRQTRPGPARHHGWKKVAAARTKPWTPA